MSDAIFHFWLWLLTIIILTAYTVLLAVIILGLDNGSATIGGITVPTVHCEEDEVISWLGPDRLGCVHFEELK